MPTLAAEQRIQADAFEVGVSIAQLASYTGVHRTSLTEKIATGTLGNDLAEKILETLNVMKQLRYQAKLPIAWDQIVVCRPIVELALVEYRETKDPTPDTFYVLSMNGFSYFTCVRNGEPMATPSVIKAAAFADIEQAGTASRELRFRFKTNAQVISIPNHTIRRKKSTMAITFEEVGLTGDSGGKQQ